MVEVTYKKKKSFKAIIGVTIFIFVVLLATLITVIVISAQKGDDYKVKKTPLAKQAKKLTIKMPRISRANRKILITPELKIGKRLLSQSKVR